MIARRAAFSASERRRTGLAAGKGRCVDWEAEALKRHFLGWQCRVRQLSVRRHEGRPTPGMRPGVRFGEVPAGEITTLLVKSDPAPHVARFRYMYLRTQDPAERRTNVVELLADAYYQRPQEFSDRLTALFGPEADLADRLRDSRQCVLAFSQFSQTFVIPCAVAELPPNNPEFEFTLTHNRLFNPGMPPGVRVLGFSPEWRMARAEPGVR